jgi:hypothetical protein
MVFFIVISDVELMMFKIKKEKEKPSCYGLTFYFEIFVAITIRGHRIVFSPIKGFFLTYF